MVMMSKEISLEQVAESAHQAKIICCMMETYPDRMADSEELAIASLLRRLACDLSAWLIEEQASKTNN